jgi:hypothetical protein
MKRDEFYLFLLVLVLLAAMVITLFLSSEKSRHGYGGYIPAKGQSVAMEYELQKNIS